MTHKQIDWSDVTIQYFFSHPDGYFKRAAAMMLADKIIPGMHDVMSDELVGDREMDHSYRIFLALERGRKAVNSVLTKPPCRPG